MTTVTPAYTQIAAGLRFPEGPMAMPDGSVILVEMERRTLSRVAFAVKSPDWSRTASADGTMGSIIGPMEPG